MVKIQIMKKYIFFLFSLTFLFSSCEKEIEFTGEIQEPKLVVNSLFVADSALNVDVLLSKFFLDSKTGFDTIKNADVSLYVNGDFNSKLSFTTIKYVYNLSNSPYYDYTVEKNTYHTDYKPQPGDSLTIIVKAPGYDEVRTYNMVPQRPEITGLRLRVDTTDYYEYTTYDDNFQEVTRRNYYIDVHYFVTIKDNPNEKNYYRIIMRDFNGYNCYLRSDDPIFSKTDEETLIGGFDGSNTFECFSDELFNGETRTISFINSDALNYGEDLSRKKKTLDIQQISKESYLYILTSDAAQNNEYNLFSEPVLTYSNVQGGYGIFASFTKLKDIIVTPL